MKGLVRVIECGGKGPRMVYVEDGKVTSSLDFFWPEGADLVWLDLKIKGSLQPNTKAVIFSVAGTVYDNCRIGTCPNVPMLNELDVQAFNSKIPIFVCNDMEAATTGMATLFPELPFFLGVTWSSGLGARIWKDKKIISDSEAGHLKIDHSPFAAICGCGQRGCAEAYLGGISTTKFIVGQAHYLGDTIPPDIHPCKWLDICYKNHEAWAIRHYKEVIIPAMGMFLAAMQNFGHFPAVVWKGSFALNAFSNIPCLEHEIRVAMQNEIMDEAWINDMKFEFVDRSPIACCPADHDAYIGAARIAEKLLTGS